MENHRIIQVEEKVPFNLLLPLSIQHMFAMFGDSRVDYGNSRNLALTSVIFVTGLSGVAVNFGNIQLKGMVLACVAGMILSLIFYLLDRFHLTNEAG